MQGTHRDPLQDWLVFVHIHVDIQQEVRVGRSNCAFKALVLDPEKGLLEGNKPLRHSGDILRISSKAKVREQEELSLKEFAILEEKR